MKTQFGLMASVLLACAGALAATPLGTAITYQGRLLEGSHPANGSFDFWFKVYDALDGGTQQGVTIATNGVSVTNGRFAVGLDFGPGVFTGGARWLDIWVHNSTNPPNVGWVWLSPLQPLTPTPSAVWATNAALAAQAGTVVAGGVTAPQFATPIAPSASQLLGFDGAGLAWTTRAVVPPSGWFLGGNTGTIPGTNYVGTTDPEPFQLRANGVPGFCLTPSASAGVNIAGGLAASIAPGTGAGTIGGGMGNALADSAHSSTIAGGQQNQIGPRTQLGAIGGGGGNTISTNAGSSAIGGGQGNAIGASVGGGAIVGGSFNRVNDGATYGVIGGGGGNAIGAGAAYNRIGGGAGNQIGAGAWYSTVVGGTGNVASNQFATVAGGSNHVAGGIFSSITGGSANVVTNEGDTIGGGAGNTASGGDSVVRGGQFNRADGLTSGVGGGNGNWAEEWDATVSGGATNWAYGVSSTIAGGAWNEAVNYWGTVGGGQANSAGYITTILGGLRNVGDNMGLISGGTLNVADGWCSLVTGGYSNRVDGAYSFAAGRRANAKADGAFVWADSMDAISTCVVTNRFTVRATGGVAVNAGTNNLELAGGGLKVTGAGLATRTPAFIHQATSGNTSGFSTTISNPYADGNPGALLLVTHNWSQDYTSETHPVGLYYGNGHWILYHEDGATMPVGMAYNVLVIRP